jgi:hypothetical protein
MIAGNSNFTKYQQSLERLKHVNANYVCGDHYGCVAGEEAKHFIEDTARMAAEFRSHMEAVYLKTKDINAAAKQLNEDFSREIAEYMVPPQIYEGVFRQMVRHVANALEGNAV